MNKFKLFSLFKEVILLLVERALLGDYQCRIKSLKNSILLIAGLWSTNEYY